MPLNVTISSFYCRAPQTAWIPSGRRAADYPGCGAAACADDTGAESSRWATTGQEWWTISSRFFSKALTHPRPGGLRPVLSGLGWRRCTSRDLEGRRSWSSEDLTRRSAMNFRPASPDARVIQGARERLLEVGDALIGILPDPRGRPVLEVQAAFRVAVGEVGLAERDSRVVDHHHRLGAGPAGFVRRALRAEQPLLGRLAVGVLDHHRQQLQGVAVRERRAAFGLVHQVSSGHFHRNPARLHRLPEACARRWLVEGRGEGAGTGSRHGRRSIPADDPHRVHPVGRKPRAQSSRWTAPRRRPRRSTPRT